MPSSAGWEYTSKGSPVPRPPLHSMLIGYAHTAPPLEEKVQQNAQRNTWAASRDEAWIANAPVRFWALFAHFSISYWNKTFLFPFPYFIWIEFENAAIRFWALLAQFSKIWNWNKKLSLLFHFPFEFENDFQSRHWKFCSPTSWCGFCTFCILVIHEISFHTVGSSLEIWKIKSYFTSSHWVQKSENTIHWK